MAEWDLRRIPRQTATLTEYGAGMQPQLTVQLGEHFIVETMDNVFGTVAKPGDRPELDRPPIHARQYARVNPLAGPVHVEGVDDGDTLVVEIEEIALQPEGWTGTIAGSGPIAGLAEFVDVDQTFGTILRYERGPSGTSRDGEAVMDVGREVRWPLSPFVGTIVTAPERGTETSLIGQGPWGGNIDVRDVAAGNRIHLNSSHPGGLLFLGDVHASQADSEATGVAAEAAADVRMKCDVIRERTVPGVCRIEKPGSLVQVDSARNAGGPERALTSCFLNMIRWLRDDFGMDPREAYLHMGANSGVRVNVYQCTNGVFSCGVEFPKASI